MIELLIDSNRGQYIPKGFAEDFMDSWSFDGDFIPDKKILSDPEHEGYWEEWDSVLSNAFIVINGVKYGLHQDGDLWAIQANMEDFDALVNRLDESMPYAIRRAKNHANRSLHGDSRYEDMTFTTGLELVSGWFDDLDLPGYIWFDEGFGELDRKNLKVKLFGKALAPYL